MCKISLFSIDNVQGKAVCREQEGIVIQAHSERIHGAQVQQRQQQALASHGVGRGSKQARRLIVDLETGEVLPALQCMGKASSAEFLRHQHALEGQAHAGQLEDSCADSEEQQAQPEKAALPDMPALPEKPMSRRAAREIEELMDSMQETAPSRQRRPPAQLAPALPAVPRCCPPSRDALPDGRSSHGQHHGPGPCPAISCLLCSALTPAVAEWLEEHLF